MIGLLLQPVVQTITTVMTTVQFTSQTATHQWSCLSQPAWTITTKRRQQNWIVRSGK